MELGSISTALRRFWLAAIVVFAVVLGLGLYSTREAPTWYVATGQYTLVQPALTGALEEKEMERQLALRDQNPYGMRDRGAAALGAASAARLAAPAVQQSAPPGAQGFSPSAPDDASRFAVTKDEKEALYTVSSWSTDEQAALTTAQFALGAAAQITSQLQAEARAPAPSQFVAATVVPAQLSPTTSSSGLKVLIAYAGLALVAGLAFAVLIESFTRLGRRRRTPDETPREA